MDEIAGTAPWPPEPNGIEPMTECLRYRLIPGHKPVRDGFDSVSEARGTAVNTVYSGGQRRPVVNYHGRASMLTDLVDAALLSKELCYLIFRKIHPRAHPLRRSPGALGRFLMNRSRYGHKPRVQRSYGWRPPFKRVNSRPQPSRQL